MKSQSIVIRFVASGLLLGAISSTAFCQSASPANGAALPIPSVPVSPSIAPSMPSAQPAVKKPNTSPSNTQTQDAFSAASPINTIHSPSLQTPQPAATPKSPQNSPGNSQPAAASGAKPINN